MKSTINKEGPDNVNSGDGLFYDGSGFGVDMDEFLEVLEADSFWEYVSDVTDLVEEFRALETKKSKSGEESPADDE
jgi:hypothetical protein